MAAIRDKLYLLDANVIIHAHDYYYHMGRVPEFWEWLLHHAVNGSIKMPIETKVPDVCGDLGVECHNIYFLLKALNFSTNWAQSV